MTVSKSSMLLYAVTDRSWLDGQTLYEQVEQSLMGGVTFLQLREKDLSEDQFLSEAFEIKKLAGSYHVPFIINDSLPIALACDADGVHVGQRDLDALIAREKLGPDKIIGVSVRTVEQAILAQEMGADYLGVGAVFSTSTKLDAQAVRLAIVKEISSAVSIPVVAIGGIHARNIPALSGCGLSGIAVVSALYAQKDIQKSARNLLRLSQTMVNT